MTTTTDAAPTLAGLEASLAASEARWPDIRPGCAKRILWAGEVGRRSDTAIVYLHGFSATGAEVSPVPERVAAALGANLFLTRLAGHGRSSTAMAEPTPEDWLADLDEAVAVGAALGERVWLIGCSTGATLAALAVLDPRLAPKLAGVVLLSPNFGLGKLDWSRVTLPVARHWARLARGGEIGLPPRSEAHGAFWTCNYPAAALLPMAKIAVRGLRADWRQAARPALFLYSPEDHVVSVPDIRRVAGLWGKIGGGPAELLACELGPEDDIDRHILGGDILSPGQTDLLAIRIESFLRSHS